MPVPNIPLPTWVPIPIQELVREAEQAKLSAERRLSLERLATDKRMRNVWAEFLRRDRGSRQFLHPALPRRGKRMGSKDERQFSALRELFHFAFTAARDGLRVTKEGEVQQNKKLLLENAAMLRRLANDLDLARTKNQFGVADPMSKRVAARDVKALRNVANWLEHLISAMRRPDDPLMVKKNRGDPAVRAVIILIATKLEELFGNRMDGTAATLASVALGVKTSARASRSALSKPNPTEKAGSARR